MGIVCSESTKKKIGDANRGRKWTQEQKNKLKGRIGNFKDKHFSEESKKKISIAHKGMKSSQFIDITGHRFGKLVAYNYFKYGSEQRIYWLCKCDCGELTVSQAKKLRTGITKSCGCLRKIYGRSNKGKYIGEKSVCYNHNISDMDRQSRRFINGYTDFMSNTKVLYGRKCIICGQSEGRIESHHIEGWSINKDSRLDYSNIAVLCSQCHKSKMKYSYHSIYGIKADSACSSNFEEWVNQMTSCIV